MGKPPTRAFLLARQRRRTNTATSPAMRAGSAVPVSQREEGLLLLLLLLLLLPLLLLLLLLLPPLLLRLWAPFALPGWLLGALPPSVQLSLLLLGSVLTLDIFIRPKAHRMYLWRGWQSTTGSL